VKKKWKNIKNIRTWRMCFD